MCVCLEEIIYIGVDPQLNILSEFNTKVGKSSAYRTLETQSW
jgi:hypothetical protein